MFARFLAFVVVAGFCAASVYAFRMLVVPWLTELGVRRSRSLAGQVRALAGDRLVVERFEGDRVLLVDGPPPELVVTGQSPRLRAEVLTGLDGDGVTVVRFAGSVELSARWPRTFLVPARRAKPLPGMVVVRSGDPRFDQAFTVETVDDGFVSQVLVRAPFREQVEQVRFPFVFRFEGDRLLVRFEGPVDDPARFVVEAVTGLSGVASEAGPGVPFS